MLATGPSSLQPVHQAKSCFDLLHLDHMTQCHVSFAMSSFIITCVSFAISPSHFHLHSICCSHTCTYGLITCVSHINTISPTKLSLNYQNQTRTFHLCSQSPGGPYPCRAGHGSLLVGALPRLSRVDGHLPCSFARISIRKRPSVNFSMYLCLCPAKQCCPNTCVTRSIVNAYVLKFASFSSFYI